MSCLPKPVLRGFAQRKGLKYVIGGVTFGIINAAVYHFSVAAPKVKKYEEFLSSYDIKEHLKQLDSAGLLQCTRK